MKLQTKFLALILAAGLLGSGLVLVLIQGSVHSIIIGGIEKSSVVLALASMHDLAAAMASRREMDLLPVLQKLQREEGALYAAALDPDGKILAHTTVTEKGRIEDDEFTRAGLSAGEPRLKKASVRGEPVLLITVPVWPPAADEEFLLSGPLRAGMKGRMGTLKLAVPLRVPEETETRILRDISLIVVLIGASVCGLFVLLARGMLAPIHGLMAGIARIGRGQFDVKVPVLSRDELGELAESFNAMSGELARTTVSKEYVEGVLENMDDMLVVTGPEGLIQTVNRAAAEALGEAEVVGRPLASIFDPPPKEELVRDAEVVLRTKDGGRMPALYSSSVFHGRDGRLRGFIGVAKDITARKRSEEALLAAKLAAEASNRELETFSYSVAHDLRAPLRAVDGFSQLLLSEYAGKLDEAGKDYLNRVRQGSKRMGHLIDDLLNLSRITRTVLRPESVDLSALAAAIGDELSKAEPGRRVDFVVAPNIRAWGDPNLLRVTLVNLLGNSWKYTSKHAAARIEFGAKDRGGNIVYFVRDDGAGFDMALAKRLFEPFTRLHAANEFEGTGIGLATVQRVVSRHGGRVWAESAVERGAVFYFTLWERKS
ncbi:MAG: HAMP domain-containing protein [Elusimicrobia bacterium]|nr:HAMP domain-containing protein [Elusimicrobiota bacterium]